MGSAIRDRHRPAVDAYDIGQFRTIVGVGGGNGALMVEIMTAYSQPTGIVFDVPRLATGARKAIMLATFGIRHGRVRTSAEFQALLRAAGFTLTARVPTHASVWVIEALPSEGAASRGWTMRTEGEGWTSWTSSPDQHGIWRPMKEEGL